MIGGAAGTVDGPVRYPSVFLLLNSVLFVQHICCRYAIPDNSYSVPANVGVDELNKLINTELTSGDIFCDYLIIQQFTVTLVLVRFAVFVLHTCIHLTLFI